MIKRKLRLQLKKIRFKASRSRLKNKAFIKKMKNNREILIKSDIKIEVELKRSLIGKLDSKVKTLKALGLKRIGDKKVHILNKSLQGMLNSVISMVLLSEVKND
ncbi:MULTISPECIES: 50S ribosomal protein L30 [Borrelia]|uniref:Large ribosomal subunit protein uL30 n=2 Tax=Borrelia turicatae TaxID=142 RepID=A0A172XBF0_BORTU|nr:MULTISPECIES: 50S ribosomal protein L30 [Borrelia]AAX17824.1 LSU ribosomal protein L30P [Borrelia turicatae 91E135]ANF33963.1 50S ribosomal protein L30 [Borrelia turicatae]UPA12161.1 50S ribosomal protein L30 [Borrelia venezuelensis]UPA13333.1 50S ribosomal protein L30 [Borrelia turicatae 91E135]UPA14818.1 50S ribosomal protein L30 [Borrelia turicatae]